MRKNVIAVTLTLATVAMIAQGCVLIAAAGAGAGTIAYIKGEFSAMEAKKLDTAYNATKKALTQLKLSITKDNKDATSATIVARDAEDKKITVRLTEAGDNITKISIRIGVFGDKTKSEQIYQQIKKNL